MKLLLNLTIVTTTIITVSVPSFANFGGISMEMSNSPIDYIEKVIDDVVHESQLDYELVLNGKSEKNMKRALLKGALKDDDVLKSLVRMREETLPAAKEKAYDDQQKELAFNQTYLTRVAEEFGFRD